MTTAQKAERPPQGTHYFTFKFDPNMPDTSDTSRPTFDTAYNNPEADVTLISSDNIAFKVYEYQLQAHSPVFRDMVSSCSDADPKIEFTDFLIERSGVLRIFLDLINDTTPTTSHQTLGHFRNCIAFAQKYSCHTVLWGLDKFSWGFLATPLVISA